MIPREKMRLAAAAMGGDKTARAKLAALGLRTETIAALGAIMADAVAEMSPAERAADESQGEFELDALVKNRPLS